MFKMKTRKMFAVVTAVSLVTTVLAGCGSGSSSDNAQNNGGKGKVTISYWAGDITPERNSLWEDKIIKPFEAKNPNIDIDYLGIPNKPAEKVDVSLAAGSPPSIAEPLYNASYIARGVLEPLDEYFNKSPLKDKIDDKIIQSVRALDAKEGKLYAIPYLVLPSIFWVRSDWFKEANVKIPETWDEFFDAANKLTDKSKGRYGYSIRGGAGSAAFLEQYMYSYSGILKAFTTEGKSTINDPLHVTFVEKYLGMYNVSTPEDDVTKSWEQLGATFQSGKAAMIGHNLGSGPPNEAAFNSDYSKFQAIPYPKSVKGYIVHPSVMPNAFPIFKDSKNKEEAWKFIEHMVEKDQNNEIAQLYGFIPANKDNANADWLKKRPYMEVGAKLLNDPNVKFYESIDYLPETAKIRNDVSANIQKVMLKKMTVKELLDDWAMKVEKAKKDFDASLNKK